MPLILTGKAVRGGSVGMKITVVDQNGDGVTPTAATWTLTDLEGNVINSRTDVAITPLASEMTVILSGDDLPIADTSNEYEVKLFTFEGTYNDGSNPNTPIRESGEFPVYDTEVAP